LSEGRWTLLNRLRWHPFWWIIKNNQFTFLMDQCKMWYLFFKNLNCYAPEVLVHFRQRVLAVWHRIPQFRLPRNCCS
jgi:hypothetical protein